MQEGANTADSGYVASQWERGGGGVGGRDSKLEKEQKHSGAAITKPKEWQ